jgi:hypothetical protein
VQKTGQQWLLLVALRVLLPPLRRLLTPLLLLLAGRRRVACGPPC